MSKRCVLVDPTVPATELYLPVNWTQCVLCQNKTREKLQCPANSIVIDKNSGYESLATVLLDFDKIGTLPPSVVLSRLDTDGGLLETFRFNKAKWHKSCRSKFSPRELQRISSSIDKTCASSSLADDTMLSDPLGDDAFNPLNKRRCMRSNISDIKIPGIPFCFFCDMPAGSQGLHEVMTLELGNRVRECALSLSDDRLLAKLATSDMVAIEAKYHSSCLAQLYNRRRSYERAQYNLVSMPSCSADEIHGMVFAELVAYINDVRSVNNIRPVFKLVDLRKMYVDRLQQIDGQIAVTSSLHSTRLKDKLLEHFPDMRSQNDGRDVILVFDDDIGTALFKACSEDFHQNAICLSKAAEIVRREIFGDRPKWSFNGSFQFAANCDDNSVPNTLLALVSMILEGPSIDVQSLQQNVPAAASIAQLIVFNSVQHKRTNHNRVSVAVRHNKKQETPLPLYIGLTVHAATRKKSLIDKLFDIGVCVSYDRLMSILSDLASGVCQRFEVEQAVCPLNFKGNLFTTAAVDNIDHNPSSTSAQGSFHGTGISLQQHPDLDTPGTDRMIACLSDVTPAKSYFNLPLTYTCVPPIRLITDEPTVSSFTGDLKESGIHLSNAMKADHAWLDSIWQNWQTCSFDSNSIVSWSAYHAQKQTAVQHPLSLCGMLPLFHENAHNVAMIRHSMDVVQAAVSKLNPGQAPVITFDQPLYALAKLIQWNWPETYGADKFVIMFGGLHIEMAALKALGSLLGGSGWVEAVTEAGLVTPGSAEALLSASHVRRCRHIHEITLGALHILQCKAFDNYRTNLQPSDQCMSFESWCESQCSLHKQFAFWSLVKKFENTVLLFVRSFRESNFGLYLDTMISLMPWFFALDRTNYARWLSVHIRDMTDLPNANREVFNHLNLGKFTIQKTARKFSGMSIDQAHEQLNAVVKGDGGVVGLTENETALQRWILAGPEVARLLAEFRSSYSSGVAGDNCHHEQQASIQKSFVRDVANLVRVMEDFGNPFEDEHDLIVLHSRVIITAEASDAVWKVHDIGQGQYIDFVTARLMNNSVSLFAPLKRNKLSFFSAPKPTTASKIKSKITASRNDSALFSRLFIACQIRNSDLDEFFRHENQASPPSLSDAGSLHLGSKSDLLSCLSNVCQPTLTSPCVDGLVIDGAAIVNMLQPKSVGTFADYANRIFIPYIEAQLAHVKRIDIVWDRYDSVSLKGLTRAKRGCGIRRQVTESAPVPRNWHDFLRNDDNKTALFTFLSQKLSNMSTGLDKHIVVTLNTAVLSTKADYDIAQLSPCTHEEADTRIFLHAADLVRAGYHKILIKTVDTDVVVLAVAFQQKIACHELWVAIGTGHHLRYIPAHELACILGPERACALPMFHAFTGCDTVSAFVGRGKKTCWEVWNKYPDVTTVFNELTKLPPFISNTCLTLLECFTNRLYDLSSHCSSVNSARRKLFAQKGRTMENIPPTQDALVQHIKRAVYQAGYVWSQALVTLPVLPNPADWGWVLSDNLWQPLWMTLPDAAKCCPELKRCGCATGCSTKRCRCFKDNLPCTALCACDAQCKQ